MKHTLLTLLLLVVAASGVKAQVAKVYDESADPMEQIDRGLREAKQSGKNLICQVGGNWCPWCLLFADFVTKDEEIASVISNNYVYIHVNCPKKAEGVKDMLRRLGNPQRFGFPSLVVLDSKGKVIHIQDSSFLEEGKSYDRAKVLRFLNCWTPSACKGI